MKYLLIALAMAPAVLFAQTPAKGEFEVMISAYYECSVTAEDRLLTSDEQVACTGIYQDIKMSFIHGMDAAQYIDLPAMDKAEVNTRAYLAFKAWEAENANVVSELKKEIREWLGKERQPSV